MRRGGLAPGPGQRAHRIPVLPQGLVKRDHQPCRRLVIDAPLAGDDGGGSGPQEGPAQPDHPFPREQLAVPGPARREHHEGPWQVELENAIERAVVLARGERIELEDLLLDASGDATSDPSGAAASSQSLHDFLDHAAARQIESVLAEVGGVRTKAAERLGVDRTTLYRLMRKYGISDAAD